MDKVICQDCDAELGSKPSCDGTDGTSHGLCDPCFDVRYPEEDQA